MFVSLKEGVNGIHRKIPHSIHGTGIFTIIYLHLVDFYGKFRGLPCHHLKQP